MSESSSKFNRSVRVVGRTKLRYHGNSLGFTVKKPAVVESGGRTDQQFEIFEERITTASRRDGGHGGCALWFLDTEYAQSIESDIETLLETTESIERLDDTRALRENGPSLYFTLPTEAAECLDMGLGEYLEIAAAPDLIRVQPW